MSRRRVPPSMVILLFAFLPLLGCAGATAPRAKLADTPLPGQGPGDAESLMAQEAYWAARLTYPTGVFNPRWLLDAADADNLIARAVPAGQADYSPEKARTMGSPLTLSAAGFTALGPQPLQSDGCDSCYNYGHVSGRVNVIAIDPVTPNVAYLGSVGGGVWKSTNCCSSSTSWSVVTDLPVISTIAIDDITIDPNDHNVVYAATGDLNFGSFSMGTVGLLKSTNQGQSWMLLGTKVFNPAYTEAPGQFPQYQAIGKVRVDPRNNQKVIVGTKTGPYFSHDGGLTWIGPCIPDNFPGQRQDVTGLLVSDNGSSTDVYAAVGTRGFATPVQYDLDQNGANGIYKTTVPASGCPASWTLLTTSASGWPAGTAQGQPYPVNTLGRLDIAMAPSDHRVIYAQAQSIASSGGQLGLWRTTNGGVTWQARSSAAALGGCGMDYNQNWYDQGLAVDPNNPNTLFMDTFDIWKSTDGGTSFVDVTCGYNGGTSVHVDQHALAYVPGSSSVLLAGSDGGAYVSTNANGPSPAFTSVNDSINSIEFYSGDITANFATAATPGINAGAQDNGASTYQWTGNPGPAMWQVRAGGDGFYARIEPGAGQVWYQENNGGGMNVSVSGAAGPFLLGSTGGWTADTRSFVMPFEIYKFCTAPPCTHLIAGSIRVWETITGGAPFSDPLGATTSDAWQAMTGDLTKGTLGARSFINQLSYAPSDQTVVIVGTNDGNVQYLFNMGQPSADLATTVDVTGGNAVLPNRPVLDVATDPGNPLIGYAAVGGFNANTPTRPGHVFQVTCTANCATFVWADKTGNLPDIPVDSIIANPKNAKQIFAGTDWGLYFTNDVTVPSPLWYRFDAGLPHAMIWDMAVDRGTTTLAVFTRSRGAYAWPLPSGDIPAPASDAGSYFTLTPCRVLDTRNPNGQLGGPALQPNSTRTFGLLSSSCGIPADAVAVSLNLTVAQPAATGNLNVYAGDIGPPATSASSFSAGQTRANNAVVALSSGGSGAIGVANNSNGTLDFIVDVNGYFK